MSRLPRSSFLYKARDSTYPAAPHAGPSTRKSTTFATNRLDNEPSFPALAECVAAAERAASFTREAQIELKEANDVTRLATVLAIEQVCELVPESTVHSYASSVAVDIEEQTSELIERASEGLQTLRRYKNILKSQEERERARSRPPSRGATGPQDKKLQTLKKQAERREQELSLLEAELYALESETSNKRR